MKASGAEQDGVHCRSIVTAGRAELIAMKPGSKVFRFSSKAAWRFAKLQLDGLAARRELAILSALPAGFPAPTLVAAFVADGWNWTVTEDLGGRPAEALAPTLDQSEKRKWLCEAGALLAMFHQGALSAAEEVLQTRPELHHLNANSWSATAARQVEIWTTRVVQPTPEVRRALERLQNMSAGLPQRMPQPTVIHCDYTWRNLIVHSGRCPRFSLVDFETALVGDPTYDLTKLLWLHADSDPGDRQDLITGYRRCSALDIDIEAFEYYTAMQALAAIQWLDQRRNDKLASAQLRARAVETLLKWHSLVE